MTSTSSSKNEEDLTFTYGEAEESPSLPVPMLMLQWLGENFLAFAQSAIKSDWSIWMRKTVDFFSCASVLIYVAGYTCGYWLRKIVSKLPRG